MTQANLKDTLRSMVLEYGFERVDKSLRGIRMPKRRKVKTSRDAATDIRKTKPKVTASQYVAKMELQPEKMPSVAALAGKFQDKSFLPTFGDIANFCQTYGVDEPASRSRASAVPRVFKFIASMEAGDIQRLLDEGMFSGPSRLGPIADAIRRNGRGGITANSDAFPDEVS